jgi:hypothetical protein
MTKRTKIGVCTLLLPVIGLAYACGGDDDLLVTPIDAGSDASQGDANGQTDAPSDSALSDSGASDSATQDSGGDAADAGPTSGPVTVIYTDSVGNPINGAVVFFYDTSTFTSDADGGTIADAGAPQRVVTDSSGTAVATVLAGGSILVADPTNHVFISVSNVEPNDVLYPAKLAPATNTIGTFDIVLDNPGTDAGATFVGATLACANHSTPFDGGIEVTGNITPPCLESDGKFLFVAEANDSAGNPLQIAYSDYAVDGGVVTDTIAPGAWVATTTEPVTYVHADAGAPQIRLMYPHKDAIQLVQGLPVNQTTLNAPPAAFTTLMSSNAVIEYPGTGIRDTSHYQRLVSPGGLTEDVSSYLPEISAVTLSGSVAPRVSWSYAAAGPSSQIAAVEFFGPYAGDAGSGFSIWTAVSLAGADSTFTVPPVPSEFGAYVSSSWSNPSLVVASSSESSYAILRQNAERFVAQDFNDAFVDAGTADVKYSSYSP